MTIPERALLAQTAARQAGEMLLTHRDFHVFVKGQNDFVTEMDTQSEHLIRDTLLGACPQDGFYGEEGGGTRDEAGRWIVDPIDGTMNFVKDFPAWCISIAYEQQGELVIGCVYMPFTDEMFVGVKGMGATLNGKPIHVSTQEDLSRAIVAISFAHRDDKYHARTMTVLPELSARTSDLRRTGSAATDLCYTACGRFDGYMELGIFLYDYAAGAVILKEAGGTLSGWDAGDDGISTGRILASNTLLHGQLKDILGKQPKAEDII